MRIKGTIVGLIGLLIVANPILMRPDDPIWALRSPITIVGGFVTVLGIVMLTMKEEDR